MCWLEFIGFKHPSWVFSRLLMMSLFMAVDVCWCSLHMIHEHGRQIETDARCFGLRETAMSIYHNFLRWFKATRLIDSSSNAASQMK